MRQSKKQNGHVYIRPTPVKIQEALAAFSWMAWVDGTFIPKKTPVVFHRVPRMEHINYA